MMEFIDVIDDKGRWISIYLLVDWGQTGKNINEHGLTRQTIRQFTNLV